MIAGRFLAALALAVSLASAAMAKDGILLLAHGNHSTSGHGAAGHEGHAAPNPWNDSVEAVAKTVREKYPVEIAFGGVCRNRGRTGDACSYVPVRWQSTDKANGRTVVSTGTDQVNAVYVDNRWRLCDSDFIGTTTLDGKPTLRRFKK